MTRSEQTNRERPNVAEDTQEMTIKDRDHLANVARGTIGIKAVLVLHTPPRRWLNIAHAGTEWLLVRPVVTSR